jgi:hypothetical protein
MRIDASLMKAGIRRAFVDQGGDPPKFPDLVKDGSTASRTGAGCAKPSIAACCSHHQQNREFPVLLVSRKVWSFALDPQRNSGSFWKLRCK